MKNVFILKKVREIKKRSVNILNPNLLAKIA